MGHSPQGEPMDSHIQTKFTPGPWVGFNDQGKLQAILPAGRPGDICGFDAPPSDADANLMIAAPDLADSLKHTLRMLEAAYRQLGKYSPHNPRIVQARAALRKAGMDDQSTNLDGGKTAAEQ